MARRTQKTLRSAGREPARARTRGLFYPERIEVRAVDAEKRQATFVAATEGGVETWAGPEHLRMSGANLDRFRKNPVILDTHNRYEAGAIIGRALRVWIEQDKLLVEIEFAATKRAEEIWTLVRDGFLSALSVGFLPVEIMRLGENETYGTGDRKVVGPARVIIEWELFEISVVPVPADADALKRSFFGDEEDPRNQAGASVAPAASRTRERSRSMDPKFKQYLEARGLDPDELTEHTLEALKKDFDAASQRSAPAGEDTPVDPVKVVREHKPAGERSEEVVLRERVMAVCPESLREYAEGLLLAGGKVVRNAEGEEAVKEFRSFEEYRRALLEEAKRQSAPVGSTEPQEPGEHGKGQERSGAPQKVEDLDDDVAIRAIAG